MKQIKIEPITVEAFAPFGSYYEMESPTGYALSGELHRFFPDRMSGSSSVSLGFSPLFVKKPDKMVITAVEYHTTSWEMILGLNDDMVLHVAPASNGVPVTHLTKAFLVPKGSLVKLNKAIWHLAPLPSKAPELHAMVILDECTYMNDCTVVDLKPEEQFEIVT